MLGRIETESQVTTLHEATAATVASVTDEQLMERLQQGQTDALDQLYRRYARKLCAFCYNATCSSSPEDLVQDVFVRVIKGAHTFKPDRSSFSTWVFRIARNRCIDISRRERIIKFVSIRKWADSDDGVEEFLPEDALIDQEENVGRTVERAAETEAVRDCISELENEDEKQAIKLYYLTSKVYREIGEILGKSTSMARNRVKSAQDKVKRCLERKGFATVS